MSKKLAEVVTRIVSELEELPSDERQRAIAGAFAILGENFLAVPHAAAAAPHAVPQPPMLNTDPSALQLSANAARWKAKNGVSDEHVEEAFHLEGGKVTLILGEMPGRSKREQTINAYILTGVAALLESGKGDFTDELARQNCVAAGCYDAPNHGKYLRDFGNQITGSKSTGWTLTAPGQTAGAALLKAQKVEAE